MIIHYHNILSLLSRLAISTSPYIIIWALFGCGGIPIATHPVEEFVDKEEAQLLVGSTKEVVIQKLGKPDWELSDNDKGYFIYKALGEIDAMWDIFIPFIILPPEAYGSGGPQALTIYCALFEFDQSNILRRIDINSNTYHGTIINQFDVCMYQLFPHQEAEKFIRQHQRHKVKVQETSRISEEGKPNAALDHQVRTVVFADQSNEELLYKEQQGKKAKQSEADTQFQLYWQKAVEKNLDYSHRMLCKAADNSHPDARYRLAQIYEYGEENVEKNYIMAYMWYKLAGESGKYWGGTNALRLRNELLSPEDVAAAEDLYRNWRPGQCESQLGLSY